MADAGVVVCLAGELTGDAAQDWEDLVHRIWATGDRAVILDLTDVTLLTCPAIHALVRCASRARYRRVAFTLVQVPAQAARLLHWAHLHHLIASHLDVGSVRTRRTPPSSE